MYITQNDLVKIARDIGIDMSRTVLAIYRKKNPEIYEGVFKIIRGRAILTYEREKAIEILIARELDKNSAKYDVRQRVRRDKNEITEVATKAVDEYIANKRPLDYVI